MRKDLSLLLGMIIATASLVIISGPFQETVCMCVCLYLLYIYIHTYTCILHVMIQYEFI